MAGERALGQSEDDSVLAGMVLIPAGEFQMGSNDGDENEKPVHTVYLDAFYLDKYEVTLDQYKRCNNTGRCEIANTLLWNGQHQPKYDKYCNWNKSDHGNHPINCVDWKNAKAYCNYVGKRLPTEAEWERVATWKNGQKVKYASGRSTVSCEDAVMRESGKWDVYGGCGRVGTWPVGSKPREINGTYDMAGNVWEWVADWYTSYPSGDQRNPKGPSSGSSRLFRGGSWYYNASYLNGTFRYIREPSFRCVSVGFRCAVSP